MGFGAGGLTSKPSQGVSFAFGMSLVLGFWYLLHFLLFSRPADALFNAEPGAATVIWLLIQLHWTVCYFSYIFLSSLLCIFS